MTNYDVFNGDTDGIFARHQLRLALPLKTVNISGVKRDVNLLRHVEAVDGDLVTVLDISHAKNRKDVLRILESGAKVEYFDHHDPAELINHQNITYHIDTDPHMTTGRIVDTHVNGKNHVWAIATAFGDNHFDLAYKLAESEGLDREQTELLKEIGLAINYNSYGKKEEDLFVAPLTVSDMLEECGEDVFA
ncbi:MAG: acetyltransferase, partial [Euryarchaeota archaeon]|nr:acetyltransferase [Euryarchaeota archaeon]